MTTRRLDDTKWTKIYAFLRLTPGIYTGNEQKTRLFIEAVYWIMRTGAPWRDLPAEFGQWNSVFNRYADWTNKGVWQKMMVHFSNDPDLEWLLLDSTIVRAHPCAAGAPKKNGGQAPQALGRSRGGFSTKVHVNTDALGNPLRLLLTAGQASDSPQAIPLLEGFDFDAVLADRGYDADETLAFIAEKEAKAVIPPKKNRLVQRDTDWYTYKERNLVERFINKIKQYRRIFTRFEKYASRYMAFLCFAATLIWLK
jgi:transposase